MIWMRHIGFWCEKLCAWKICRILASLMKLGILNWNLIRHISDIREIVLDMGGVKRNQGQWYDEPTSSENIAQKWQKNKVQLCAPSGSRTRVSSLEGSYPNRWTNGACSQFVSNNVQIHKRFAPTQTRVFYSCFFVNSNVLKGWRA